MSLLLHGPQDLIQALSKYLRFYNEVVSNNGTLPQQADDLELDCPTPYLIENKYYSADLELLLHDLPAAGASSPLEMYNFEGIILVPSNDQVTQYDVHSLLLSY